ncbi:phage holin [Lysinibacillus pakistanensis]|uniref:Uncharacterized protein n=1 Tax=Lysinibacillus pakistanensis TaxID=759811 RepID=A0ABX6DDA5_9BACI|nr:hypothetical protein GDS87_11145 [Lysinibacillus pakistanensis]
MVDELVRDVYERLGAIGEKLDGINHIRDTANRAEDKADEALASTKSAHHRPTTIGVSDSTQAMDYNKPKGD